MAATPADLLPTRTAAPSSPNLCRHPLAHNIVHVYDLQLNLRTSRMHRLQVARQNAFPGQNLSISVAGGCEFSASPAKWVVYWKAM
ncbi:hypothetical protein E2562_000781 [Oryza meyeriana var. granulata]|uniref:Uncharacterized protein n=1 Tax=Oryza meyeriana var. granulata TaxID=110450 RepID=A0A6G1DUN6_9ORYZ|nr:hypothetical protein E2562_000781 [Oryza meyeriana var. granulata]